MMFRISSETMWLGTFSNTSPRTLKKPEETASFWLSGLSFKQSMTSWNHSIIKSGLSISIILERIGTSIIIPPKEVFFLSENDLIPVSP